MAITFLEEPAEQAPTKRKVTFIEEEQAPLFAREEAPIEKPPVEGTSITKEVGLLGPAFKESLGRPLENMGEGFEVVGFQGVANALKGAITEPENYVSAAERFMEPQPGESQFLGFAWQYAPRAAVEQAGQAIGSIATRIAGGIAGAPLGPAGVATGAFVGPAIFEAAQIIGPVAKERAKNSGRETPTNQDIVAATITAAGSGALNAIGAKYLPGGEKATGKFFKRVASSFLGEGLTETPQAFVEQAGSTAGTEAGLNINVKQAIGEGLIGGTTGAGLSAITYPLTKEPKNQVIRTPEQAEEIDIQAKSNEEAVSLMGQPADQDKNELISRVNEIEKVVANNETLINSLEPNDETRTQLELENKIAKQEAGRLKGELEKSVGLAPIPTAEQQQVELAKQIAAPVEPAPKAETREQIAERLKKQEEKKEAADIKKIKIDRMVQEDAVLDELLGIDPESNESFSLTRAEKEQRLTPQQRTEYGRRMLEFSAKRLEEVTAPAEPTTAQPSTPAPAEAPAAPVSETITPAEPEGISVGNRIKLGKSPQTYTVEQVIPQSETERGLGEQFYSVKNERTGEVQTVEAKDLKIVKPSKATRKMAPVRAEEEYTPVPEADRYTFKEAANRSIRFFGGTAPENFVIVNDSQNKDYEFKAGYDPDSGEIILNRAYIQKGENIEDILTHELGHYIYSDPQFQADFQNFLESLPEQDRAEIDEIVNEGYNKETNEVQIEERQVIAFASLVRKTKRGRTAWEKVKDTIKKIINRLLNTNIKLSDQGAMAVFNVGYKRFNSGERIIREMKKGTLRTAPEGMTKMDRDYLAAVEEAKKTGDFTKVQKMVNDAARAAGYIEGPAYHGSPVKGISVFNIPEQIGKYGKGLGVWFAAPSKSGMSYDEGNAEYIADYFAGREMSTDTDGEVYTAFLSVKNPLEFQDFDEFAEFQAEQKQKGLSATQVRENLKADGYDGIVIRDSDTDGNVFRDDWVAFDSSQIKRTDPVTYDDAGNVIPLSQRFRATSPDIRRMAPEPRKPAAEAKPTGPAPESPEGQSVPQAISNGVDIGPENNMPINRKIDSHLKNFLFLRGFFESASDRLRRVGFAKLGNAIDAFFDGARRRLGDANKIMLAPLEAYEAAPSARKKKIEEDFQTFFAAQENKRDTESIRKEMDPIARRIVKAWQKFGEESGKENQRVGVKVFDPNTQSWRKIGRVEKFWPRRLKPEYQRALYEPDKYAKEYNEIVEALLEDKKISKREDAEKYLREYSPEATKNDYFSGIEKARGKPLPEKLYDYSMPVMTDYIARWAQHVSRIEQFGQKTSEQSQTLWDREMATTRDPRTKDYIQAARERVEGYFPNDPFLKGTSALNIWATGLQLGNPASAILNLIGGSTLNAMVGQPGALGSYVSSLSELRNLGQQIRDAKEKGILGRDLMNIVGDHQAILETNKVAQAGQKTADFLLKWSGFTPVEQMIRTQSLIIGKSFVRNTLNAFSENPNSPFAKRASAWITRNGFDLDKLIVENGTGPETDRVLRYFANISQGSYTIDQVPIFIDMPIGRFLFKYQKFSTQVMRMSWKNTFEPLFKAMTGKGEQVQIPDKTRQFIYQMLQAQAKELGDNRPIKMATIPKTTTKGQARALTLLPAMMWLGSAYVGGEVLLRMRDILFGVLMKGPEYEDMLKELEDDDKAGAMYLALERAWYNLIGIGALGLIGNYAQFLLDWQDRERVKNPLEPPSLGILKDTAQLVTTVVDQGTLTGGDIDNFTRSTLSAYRTTQKLAQSTAGFLGLEDIPGVKEEMFRREVANINKYARRWAEEAGIEYRMRRPTEITASPRTPVNRKIASYLQTGNPQAAVAYAKAYLNTLPKADRLNAIQSISAGARSRQPLRLGTGPMDEVERRAFLKWLQGKVNEERYKEIAGLDKQYQRDYEKFLRLLPNR